MDLRKKTEMIVVHCAATKPSMDIGASEIKKWHVDDNGWDDIGYHYIIKRGGLATNQFVNGKKIVVTKVIKDKDGNTQISVKTANGTGFYKALKSVTIDYEDALKSGEIRLLD